MQSNVHCRSVDYEITVSNFECTVDKKVFVRLAAQVLNKANIDMALLQETTFESNLLQCATNFNVKDKGVW